MTATTDGVLSADVTATTDGVLRASVTATFDAAVRACVCRLAAACAALTLLVGCGRAQPSADSAAGDSATAGNRSGVAVQQVDPGADTLWLVADDPAADALHAADSHADLERRFGAANVVVDTIRLAEGASTVGSVLFGADPERRLEIIWKDSAGQSLPDRVVARGTRSRWAVHPGISLGSCLSDLERLNGAPFNLHGFGWDYGGTVRDWQKGRLDSLWTPRLVLLRLALPGEVESAGALMGEQVFSSAVPAMRAANPCVREIVVQPR